MERSRPGRPYEPSWIDRLTDFIARLPGPWWVVYAVALSILLIVTHAAAWADGTLTPGTLDLYLSSLAIYPVVPLVAIYYLDIKASAALDEMRPALSAGDDLELLRYRITTMPPVAALIWSGIGLAFAFIYVAFGLAIPVQQGGPAVRAVDMTIALVAFPLISVLFFHTVRQLRLIGDIQRQIPTIDLFQLRPLYAFSGVTSRSGLLILALAYVSAATDPSTFVLTNPTIFAFVVVATVLAIATFILPLLGTQHRIAKEKADALAEVNSDLKSVLSEVSRRARSGDLTDADAVNKHLASAIAQRDLVARIPTWPWEPTTLRGFVTAVVLPIALWLVFRVLERVTV